MSTLTTKWFSSAQRIIYRLAAIALFLALWEVAPRIGLADPVFLPPFSKVAAALFQLLSSGELLKHIFVSLRRSFIGFSLGLLTAVPLGLAIGCSKRLEDFIDPLLQTFRQTSTMALFPVFILLFGIGELSKVAIIFWGVQWAILLNTITGVKTVDPLLIKAAKSMGTSSFKLFIKVIIPAAIPAIFTGIRLSATTSILILIAAEMIGANAGLGFLLYDAEVKYKIPTMYAAIATMSLLGLMLNYTLVNIERRYAHWRQPQ
ncbi:MAG: ABC transporter permease [Sporomusaceae bacterium]|nr:ABC transporter permease [Sporomusaceae bacterium]